MYTREEILSRIYPAVAATLGIDKNELTPESRFADDLGAERFISFSRVKGDVRLLTSEKNRAVLDTLHCMVARVYGYGDAGKNPSPGGHK